MDRQQHWNSIYQTRPVTEVSWFESEPQTSLNLIKAISGRQDKVIDIGGGASRLVDFLLAEGFESVAVLDISATAVQANRATWLVADITQAENLGQFDNWHDRAVFHFLTNLEDRRKYVDLATQTVRIGGHLIMGTFALDGPHRCSGLEVCGYDAEKLCHELGPHFKLVRELSRTHVTPAGKEQRFFFGVFEHLPHLSNSLDWSDLASAPVVST
jgi:hypothetical protein